jgi:signal transduction histidine kinase
VKLECDGYDSERVSIAVTDTGLGIPADDLEKIFEPFVQVGRSLTQSHEGTGLGLSISRDLARAMGGDVVVTSELEKGSQFRLILPRAKPA